MDKVKKISKKAPGKRTNSVAVDSHIKALQDKELYLQWEATEILGKIGDPRALKPLINVLKKGLFSTRKKAAQSLARIGKQALTSLMGALKRKIKEYNDSLLKKNRICFKMNLWV